jgi:hypothetical protein
VNDLNLKNKFVFYWNSTTIKAIKLLIIIFIFVGSIHSKAQVSTIIHQSDYDTKLVRFGYFIGIATSNYRIKHSQLFLTSSNPDVFSITSPINYGLKIGGLINFNKGERFDIRILPTVAIYSRKLWINEDPEIIPSREQAWFEIPVLFKYKSLRRNNMRMNVFVGLRPGFETNAVNLAKKSSLTRNARLRTADFSFEYGAGMELFRQFFKLAPEIHFSHGLKNMIKPASETSTSLNPIDLLDRLNTHTVTFYIMFE